MEEKMSKTVLVTGGTGFIGGWTIVESELGAGAKKVPRRGVPDLVLQIAALFDRRVQFITVLLGRKHVFSSAKAQAVLAWKPRPAATTIVDCAQSLIATGAV
jgi:dihydroflavonol-4-reductase